MSTQAVTPQFDVNAARQAGYSDDEILTHLTQSRNFDVPGALKSGYSKTDIINHLSSTPAPTATGVHMTTPQGGLEIVPPTQAANKLKQGYRIGPPQQNGVTSVNAAPPSTDQQPDNSIVGGFLRRALQTAKGVASTANPIPSTQELKDSYGFAALPGMAPVVRILQGQYGASKQAVQQAGQELHAANNPDPGADLTTRALQYARPVVTAASALDPFATSSVTNVNQLEDKGQNREAIGQGAFDIGALLAGSKAGSKVIGKAAAAVAVGPEAEQAITAAVKPAKSVRAQFRQAVQTSAGDIAQSGADSLESLRDLASQKRVAAAGKMNNALQQAGTSNLLDNQAIGDAIRKTPVSRVDAAAQPAINKFAGDYTQNPMTVEEAAKEVQTISAKQRGIPKTGPERAAYFKDNPADLALDHLKNELIRQIDGLGAGNDAFKQSRLEYGRWRTIEDATQGSIDAGTTGSRARNFAVPGVVKHLALPAAGAGIGYALGGGEGAGIGATVGSTAQAALESHLASPDTLVARGVKTIGGGPRGATAATASRLSGLAASLSHRNQ